MYLTANNTSGTATNWNAIATGTYTGGWKLALLSSVGTYSTGTTFGSTSGNTEITGTNYTALGFRVDNSGTNSTVAGTSDNTHLEFKSTSVPTWSSASFSATYAELIAATASGTTSIVLGHYDLTGGTGTPIPVLAGSFTLNFGTDAGTSGSVFNLAIQ